MATNVTAFTLGCALTVATASYSSAQEGWQAAFEDICSKVDISQTLSTKELSALIERADKLKPEIEASSDPSKKRFIQRLKKCRSMYDFMLESKNTSGK